MCQNFDVQTLFQCMVTTQRQHWAPDDASASHIKQQQLTSIRSSFFSKLLSLSPTMGRRCSLTMRRMSSSLQMRDSRRFCCDQWSEVKRGDDCATLMSERGQSGLLRRLRRLRIVKFCCRRIWSLQCFLSRGKIRTLRSVNGYYY